MDSSNTPILPTLQVIVERLKVRNELNLENVTFVCVQHFLFTTVDLIKSLIMLGARPSNIHIMGKIYSTCPKVVEQLIKIGVVYYPSSHPQKFGHFNYYFNKDIINMWADVSVAINRTQSNTIIVLDDGGKCITNIPKILSDNYKVFAVEQTSSGVTNIRKNNATIPVINTAFSAAKQQLESPMIARAVVKKLDKFLSLYTGTLSCGVVGLGVIGRAVVEKLLELNHEVVVYDNLEERYDFIKNVKIVNSTQLLFEEAEYIFGCTGEDISISLDITKMNGIKNLISCSSQDIEFQSILKIIQDTSVNSSLNILDNIDFPLINGNVKIFRGGYPINLDNSGESVPASEIQLTRGLLLGGIVQALFQLLQEPNQQPKQYMLHPRIQKLIVQVLIENDPSKFHEPLAKNFLDEEWIKNNSSGEYITSEILLRNFSI